MFRAADPILFAAEYQPVETLGRRRVPRAPVSLDAKIGRGGLDRVLCKVTDVSTHGARLQTYSGLKPGTKIWLTLPRVGHVVADIRWADDFEAGCEFETSLDAAAFATLVTG